MLILGRRIGEQIIVNGNIRITIRDFNNDEATLLIDMPETMKVNDIDLKLPKLKEKNYTKPIKQPIIIYKRKKILER